MSVRACLVRRNAGSVADSASPLTRDEERSGAAAPPGKQTEQCQTTDIQTSNGQFYK